MRALLAAALLAACSGGGAGNTTAAQAPAPKPTGPPPKTPMTRVSPEPGRTPAWLSARDGEGDPKTAPYGNLLDEPLVNGTGQ